MEHLVQNDLRRKVVWGPAQCVSPLGRPKELGKPKVCHLQIALWRQQQILRLHKTLLCCVARSCTLQQAMHDDIRQMLSASYLQISVDDVLAVQVLKR